MRTAIFDLETSNLYADSGILLCAVIKEYSPLLNHRPRVIRADQFPEWLTERSNSRPMVEATLAALEPYDLFVAHNGQFFDKTMLTSWAIKWNLRPFLRFAKFVDPVMLARRHMRLSRRTLANLLQFLEIPDEKTHILWRYWMKATIEGDPKSLDYIVQHCIVDVRALEKAYDKMRKLVKDINERGSAL